MAFSLVPEAGTFSFRGDFSAGEGGGTFRFTPDGRYVEVMRGLGYSSLTADTLYMLAWDPDQSRLVRVSLPFWLLRIGRHKVRVMREANGFDFQRLNLDVDELERIGPALVFDFRNQDGVRVLLWTQ